MDYLDDFASEVLLILHMVDEIEAHRWAEHHSDKSPIKGVYSRHCALKTLEIHQVFLRFLPSLA